MPLLVAKQRSDEWLEARKGKITASLAAACLGLDKHKGPMAAWREITGKSVQRDNPYMAHGRFYEPHALTAYENETGALIRPTGFWIHPKYPWLGASPEALIGKDGLVEIKCPKRLPTEISPPYQLQMTVQLAVTERAWCDFFAWTKDGKFYLERFTRKNDFEETATLIALYAWFVEFVQGDKCPPRRKGIRRKAY